MFFSVPASLLHPVTSCARTKHLKLSDDSFQLGYNSLRRYSIGIRHRRCVARLRIAEAHDLR
jgi:hypothetical protein